MFGEHKTISVKSETNFGEKETLEIFRWEKNHFGEMENQIR